jgi:hypothetical protein
MASKQVTKWALICNMCLDMLLVVSRGQRQKQVGKVFGSSTAVGHAFFAHALIRGIAGFNVESITLRRAAFYSLLIELYYVLTSGKSFKTMRPILLVLGAMLTIVGSTLKKNFAPKIKND